MPRHSTLVIALCIFSLPVFAQVMTEAEAVSKALANSKNIQAASLQVKQQQQLLKSSVNLPNPEFFWESPTGNFYTGSITQSIEFPTVYKNQYNLQQQKIGVAQKEKQFTEAEIKYRVKSIYLEAQFADSMTRQWYIQDTLYEKIQASAIRQFNAGQIDYLQQIFAETQYGEVHNQYLQSITRVNSLKAQLQWLTGSKDALILTPLTLSGSPGIPEIFGDSTALLSNPSVQLLKQQEAVAKQNIALQKSKALPGFAFGYFNQGERDSKWFNRFRFGLTIPLWMGQYKSNIAAAKTEYEVFQSKQAGLQQEVFSQSINANSEMQTGWQTVQYYRQSGLQKSREVITTSQRFFLSGNIDFISLLRNNTEAYNIYRKYLEAVRNYNLSVLNYQYLMGHL